MSRLFRAAVIEMTKSAAALALACAMVFGLGAVAEKVTGGTAKAAQMTAASHDAPAPAKAKSGHCPGNKYCYQWNAPTGPITATVSTYTATPCESLFGYWGAGTTLSWNGTSGTCSGPSDEEDEVSSGPFAAERHSTVEIFD